MTNIASLKEELHNCILACLHNLQSGIGLLFYILSHSVFSSPIHGYYMDLLLNQIHCASLIK